MNFQIQYIYPREILDSRGWPTLEVDLYLTSGAMGRFAVPSGASTGTHEALELRDHDLNRYQGKSVQKALQNIKQILEPKLQNQAFSQSFLDQYLCELDGTPNKSRLGANALLGISMAFAKACATQQQIPFFQSINPKGPFILPRPMMNIINGGVHAKGGLSIQEIMVVPVKPLPFFERLHEGVCVFQSLKKLLNKMGKSTLVGDEGGFAPGFSSTREALDTLIEAIIKAGFKPKEDMAIAMDAAANEFYDKKTKIYTLDQRPYNTHQLIDYWQSLCQNYPIISLEDALFEEDWVGWQALTNTLGSQVQLVGDDLFVTQTSFLEKGITQKAANAILIKPNQVGTLSETLKTIQLAQKNNYNVIVSHRSGETEDVSIAHLAVATGAQIKTGAPCRGERTAKYNELLRIEELINRL